MSKNEWKKLLGAVRRMLLAHALVFAQGAWAAQNQGTNDKADSPQKAAQQANEKRASAPATAKAESKQTQGEEAESAVAEEKPSGDGRHEGIKVHGHWTIEVKNPDGRLVTYREFENSIFRATANQTLSQILGRQISVGLWQLNLAGSVGPCVFSTGAQTFCILVEPGAFSVPPGPPFFNTLLTSVNSNNNFVLSGQATAGINGDVSSVSTFLASCAPTVAPASCSIVTGGLALTGTNASPNNPGFSAPIPVQAGQTIAVTVVISFS